MLTKSLVKQIALQIGYPTYFYDQQVIERQIKKVQDTLEHFNLLYSVKANPYPEIIKLMLKKNVGIDAASRNEVFLAREIGFKKDDIYYSSPGKEEEDIVQVIEECTIIADSLEEIKKINAVGKLKQRIISIGVRLNVTNNTMITSEHEVMGGKPSQFGISLEQFLEEIKTIKEELFVQVRGIHIYFGSQLLDEQLIIHNFNTIADVTLKLSELLDLQFVNFGGGFGIPYEIGERELDLNLLHQKLQDSMNIKKLQDDKVKCNIELGRYLVAQSGYYITKVIDVKKSFEKNYIILQGGMNQFFRPAFTGQNHEMIQFTDTDEVMKATVVGNMCTPLDTYYEDKMLKKVKIGDWIAFSNAGAYGYTMSLLEFISHARPNQVLGGGEFGGY